MWPGHEPRFQGGAPLGMQTGFSSRTQLARFHFSKPIGFFRSRAFGYVPHSQNQKLANRWYTRLMQSKKETVKKTNEGVHRKPFVEVSQGSLLEIEVRSWSHFSYFGENFPRVSKNLEKNDF